MRKLIKDILKKRFDIDVLHYFDKFNSDETEMIIGQNGLNNVMNLLLALDIIVLDINQYGEYNIITVTDLDGSIWKK